MARDRWIEAALEYVPRWIEFQMQSSQQPGCIMAVAHRGKVIFERAFGTANLKTGEDLTPRHQFRVASHSKSFTAAAVMKLREQRKLSLDDTAGQFVAGLHPRIASATIAQLLSHTAGVVRDGADAGEFVDRRPFFSTRELMADLKSPPVIEASTRFKYSNHGYGLVGLVIEAVTSEPYGVWIKREIVDAAGLTETTPDMPPRSGAPFARGHTGRVLLGRRLVIPGDMKTHAIAPAAGFVSTASDLAQFFAQLSPTARNSVLSVASRREMLRRQWRNPNSALERHYGLGIISGTVGGWDWFGHAGGLQGYVSLTATVPAQDVTVSVLTNSIDGLAGPWFDGTLQILQAFARHGPPTRKVRDWNGRWWSLWGATDLLPMGKKVMMASPGFMNPLFDAGEIEVTGRTTGRIASTTGYGSQGEPVRCKRTASGRMTELWLAGGMMLPAAREARDVERRYDSKSARARRPRR